MITSLDPRTCSENDLMVKTVELARHCGWMAVHFGGNLHGRAWYDATGFPDLLLIHPTGLVWFRELKSVKGKLSARQQLWIEHLSTAGANVDVWRPADWPDIVQALSFGKADVA